MATSQISTLTRIKKQIGGNIVELYDLRLYSVDIRTAIDHLQKATHFIQEYLASVTHNYPPVDKLK